MTAISRADLDAWQAWLAIEHEAVWLYGVIGGRVTDLLDDARAAWDRHRDTRDRLIAWIDAAGAEPVRPELGYGARTMRTPTAGRSAAREIEARVATAALDCIVDETRRPEVVAALRAAAQSAAEWGASPSAFPGLPLKPAG